jgi:multiple sugar transport system ATP-binding protein
VPVLVTEQLGSEQLLDVRLGAALLRVAAVDPTLTIRSGEAVRLSIGIEQVHLFDPETEAVVT